MNAHKLIAIALAALLVFAGGAAAMPGNAPDDPGAADDHAPDDPADDAANETDDDHNETEVDDEAESDGNETDARDENATDGPPTDMPEPVPDHVTQIHQLIRDKLNGDLGNTTLGEAISGLVGGDGDAQSSNQADSAGEESADADEQSADADEQATQSENASAGVAGDLPQQAADHVSAIHDAITSFLNGDGDGNPGDAVSSAAGN